MQLTDFTGITNFSPSALGLDSGLLEQLEAGDGDPGVPRDCTQHVEQHLVVG